VRELDSELPLLSDEDRSRVENEAKQYVEQWEETVEMRTSPTIDPIMPLPRLLAEYHDICERILDEQEWSDEKTQKRACTRGPTTNWRLGRNSRQACKAYQRNTGLSRELAHRVAQSHPCYCDLSARHERKGRRLKPRAVLHPIADAIRIVLCLDQHSTKRPWTIQWVTAKTKRSGAAQLAGAFYRRVQWGEVVLV
jgi:hypothetical protein